MKEIITLYVEDIIEDVDAVTSDEGRFVFDKICEVFWKERSAVFFKDKNEAKKVNLSFRNIEIICTAFLNTAVGQLYKDFSEEYIAENLEISDISDSGKVALKRVVETSKLYYNEPEKLQKLIEYLKDNDI